jgi:glycerol-3-phosphate dehydrogenase (NAD(P)+)
VLIGAGAWGTALAIHAAQHPQAHQVQLWARNPAQTLDMQASRQNNRYLKGHRFPDPLEIHTATPAHWQALAQGQTSHSHPIDLCIIASPMAALRPALHTLAHSNVPVAWLCKGFEAASAGLPGGLMPHEVQAQVAPNLKAGALSGPSFAKEVAQGLPAALVAASRHPQVCAALVQAFHSKQLRVYANADLVGVEVGGAVKNVLAIAAGFCDGLHLGLNARAALITRGLAEMTRLGAALGAQPETFMGLSGLGDLVLTATGDLSRNRQVGQLLAQGLSRDQAVQSLGHVAEGVNSAHTVWRRAQSLGIDMPVVQAVVALLDGTLSSDQAVDLLMSRQPVVESNF